MEKSLAPRLKQLVKKHNEQKLSLRSFLSRFVIVQCFSFPLGKNIRQFNTRVITVYKYQCVHQIRKLRGKKAGDSLSENYYQLAPHSIGRNPWTLSRSPH